MKMRRRTQKVRRFVLGVLLVSAAQLGQAACPAVPDSPETGIRRVIDGDTLVLRDGRHVRVLGINAMELGHDGGQDQPYAEAARERLQQLIAAHGGTLRMSMGSVAYDEHGRTLAYLFVGRHDLGLELVREGLAVVVAVPPDLAHLPCYQEAEAEARNHHLGIWSQASPLVTDVAHAQHKAGAFLIVRAAVTGVVRSPAGLKLMLDGRLPVWISASDLARFTTDPAELKGRSVLVRGWLREYHGQDELDVHAPAALLVED
ncbi:MAG TPA: thermonuclease family protein [Gammaproteobacteria bacterium]|nr:thermonuclease family protein [Gammaproteobacteria bacterium]